MFNAYRRSLCQRSTGYCLASKGANALWEAVPSESCGGGRDPILAIPVFPCFLASRSKSSRCADEASNILLACFLVIGLLAGLLFQQVSAARLRASHEREKGGETNPEAPLDPSFWGLRSPWRVPLFMETRVRTGSIQDKHESSVIYESTALEQLPRGCIIPSSNTISPPVSRRQRGENISLINDLVLDSRWTFRSPNHVGAFGNSKPAIRFRPMASIHCTSTVITVHCNRGEY